MALTFHLPSRKNDTRTDRIEEILETLAALGKAREPNDGRYIAV